jgi:hypothetical protein
MRNIFAFETRDRYLDYSKIQRERERESYFAARPWMDISLTMILFTVPPWLTKTTCSSLASSSVYIPYTATINTLKHGLSVVGSNERLQQKLPVDSPTTNTAAKRQSSGSCKPK